MSQQIQSQRAFAKVTPKTQNIMRIAIEYAMIVNPEKVHALIGILTHLCSWGGPEADNAKEYEFMMTPTFITFRDDPPDNPDIREGMMKHTSDDGYQGVLDLNYFDWGIYARTGKRAGNCIYNGGILYRDGEWTSHS